MPFVLLASYPLSLISNPAISKLDLVQCKSWARQLVSKGIFVVVPEVIDYELRRTLILGKRKSGIDRLNHLGNEGFLYEAITTEVMQRAAELWAWARATGQQTEKDEDIDIDVILAAHAITLGSEHGEYVVVATSNVNHIARYTPAREWQDITVENCLNPKL